MTVYPPSGAFSHYLPDYAGECGRICLGDNAQCSNGHCIGEGECYRMGKVWMRGGGYRMGTRKVWMRVI